MSKYIFIFTLYFTTQAHAVEFKTNEDILKKLSTYEVSDVTGDVERLRKKEKLKIDEIFEDLQAAVKTLEKTPPSEELAFQLERVCLLTFIHDPSTYAADLIITIYDSNQEVFSKAVKKLHPYDQKIILDVLTSKNEFRKSKDE